ncbi:MAG: glycosyltransferase [Alphaproteobacteria bacterium]
MSRRAKAASADRARASRRGTSRSSVAAWARLEDSSAAAFCAVPGTVANLLRGTPLLLSEHGVYLREQYYSIGKSALPAFQKRGLIGMVRAVAQAAYARATVVAPVAAFNGRWEQELGVPADRIRVVYNGVDPSVYQERPYDRGRPPTVVSVARIDPVKDLGTLMQAALIVRESLPDVRFIVYGGVSDPAYHRHLLALHNELMLEESFVLAGHSNSVVEAYGQADVVALSSITEGFPYAVIEAMMCGRAIVSTDVGGSAEALGDSGFLVRPRDPEEMATALLQLLRNPRLARDLGTDGRERALNLFTTQRFTQAYAGLYEELATRQQVPMIA